MGFVVLVISFTNSYKDNNLWFRNCSQQLVIGDQ